MFGHDLVVSCTFIALFFTTTSLVCLDKVLCGDSGLAHLFEALSFLVFSEQG